MSHIRAVNGMNKKPEQTEATRASLRAAYVRLLRDGQKITVERLCELAGYNRCTFYRYYADTQPLLQEIERDIAGQIRAVSEKLDGQELPRFIDGMASLYERHGDLICTLLENDRSFLPVMKEKLSPLLLPRCNADSTADAELTVAFVAGAISQTLMAWYRGGKRTPAHEVSGLIVGALQNGIFR